MAELIGKRHNLVVLELFLDRLSSSQSSFGHIVFRLTVSGEPLFEIKAECSEIGLPNNLREARKYRYDEPTYMIPKIVIQRLRDRLPKVLDSGIPLWLQLTNDSSVLPLVPWELLLEPRLHVPILRLPYFAIKPISSTSSSLDILLCATKPVAKEAISVERLLDTLTRQLLDTVKRDLVVIHIFVDADVYPRLRTILQDRIVPKGVSGVRLYDPAQASTYASPSASSSIHETLGNLENPWLLWIINSLRGRSAEMIHFICHGYLSSDLGALAFAESPTLNEDRQWARFVGAQQLTTFSMHLGASSIGFSSPVANFSESGLRLLADQVARLRPGPVLLQKVKEDTRCRDLAKAYNFLYGETRGTPPSSPALELYCHPSQVKQIAQQSDDVDQQSILNQFTLAKGETLKILESKGNAPSWVASSQRYLEQLVAQLLKAEPPSSASEPNATRKGVEEALRFLSDTLERHASSSGDLE